MKTLKEYLLISFGILLNALGWMAFLVPSEITGGGVSGIGTILFYSAELPVGLTVLVINLLLLALGVKILGARFGIKTVYASITLPMALSLFGTLIKGPVVHDAFMAAIIGGILSGAGVGIAFTQGGSTGGTDIIAMIINKYRNISPGKILLILDAMIISSSYFVFGSIEKIVYGFVSMAVVSYVVDNVLEGSKRSFQIFIFSKKHNEIAEVIASRINRGITVLNGQGWYSGKDTSVLTVIVRRFELHSVFKIVKEVDNEAFMSVSRVMGVFGKGFEELQ